MLIPCLSVQIIYLQHLFKVTVFRTYACFESCVPLDDEWKKMLFLDLCNAKRLPGPVVTNLHLVDALLHCSPDIATLA